MWMLGIDLTMIIISFYFFSIFTAHIFMYKPEPEVLFQLKSYKSSFLFAISGLILLSLFKKLKLPEKWHQLIYLVIFLLSAAGTFTYLILTITNLK